MERLLTTEDVAELLRIDPVTVRRLVMRGELVAYRIAGEYRFNPVDVEQFVQSQRIVVSSQAGIDQPAARFSGLARKVLTMANEEATRYHHSGVGPEHLLLALMRERGGVGAGVLDLLQVSLDGVRREVEALHPAGEQPERQDQVGMTTQGKESIELAAQEAQSLGHHYIGTEHLLLGLLRQKGMASQILRKSGVTFANAREVVKKVLAGQAMGMNSMNKEEKNPEE